MDEDWGTTPRLEAAKVRLRDVLKPRKTTINYLYDFGDSWEHRLTVTGIPQGEAGVAYPRYIGGEWNAPPEDCGGIPGFSETLDVIADPDPEPCRSCRIVPTSTIPKSSMNSPSNTP
jgi:hypothetical protein